MATPLDFINKNNSGSSTGLRVTDVIKEHKKTGTLNKSVQFSASSIPNTPRDTTPDTKIRDLNFFQKTSESYRAMRNGEFSFKDVVKQIPKTATRQGIAVSNFVAPTISKFFDVTGSILGEGLAYAFDSNVRKQYRGGQSDSGTEEILKRIKEGRAKGEDVTPWVKSLEKLQGGSEQQYNLDILPTITDTTLPKLAKYTIAAGLEIAIFRSIPEVARLKLSKLGLGNLGAIEGIGFAITEGLAKDETPEEIIKKMPLYGVTGGALAVLTPFLLPLLRSEVKYLPQELKNMIKGLEKEVPPPPKRLDVQTAQTSPTAVPVSTPKSRYAEYLRKQGYEPYTPDNQLPTIQSDINVGPKRDLPNVPEGRTMPVLDANNMEAPKVSSPKTKAQVEEDYLRSQGYEPYTPDAELPVIRADGKEPKATPKKTTTVEDGRDISYSYDVSYPNKAKADITEFQPKRVTVMDEAGTSKVYVKSERPVTPKVEVTDAPVVQVASKNLPVDGPTTQGRLERRLSEISDEQVRTKRTMTNELGEELGASANKEQMRRAAEFVSSVEPDKLDRILRGIDPTPEGILDMAIIHASEALAMSTNNPNLIRRLGSNIAKRAGQEVQFAKNFDPMSPSINIAEIVKARKSKAGRAVKGTGRKETVSAAEKQAAQVKKQATVAVDAARLKIEDAEKLLNDILC